VIVEFQYLNNEIFLHSGFEHHFDFFWVVFLIPDLGSWGSEEIPSQEFQAFS